MKITVYTITDCQFSKQEKEYLTTHNLPYEEKNLETNHEYLTEMLNISNNFAGTPVTKLEKDDGTVVIMKGFTAEEFDKELGFKKEEEKAVEPAKPEAPKEMQPDVAPKPDETQTMAPPAVPPEVPTPQPPAPAPQPPVVPPSIPDQAAPSMPPLSMNSEPAVTPPAPQMDQPISQQTPPVESTIDDASLDAILNQLQEKTEAPAAAAPANAPAAQTPTAGGPPNVPDFGSTT